ncbi:uncharacterized protein SETTUDRAFT_39206 [Exserohilum turcica Et28A]|uniref:Uncharacterized protein n=1 Tax=Exserohilum turcicum (strain 28A) TaxID=671987 RepID=R0K3S8_EXST2|nr:uncharacterized protein SETTUDRAFT_39206 [Exserohilum turcica Et28A]EOA87738.1 hypothetical protein SETTUDRAFT_39206 [Exserohilum turcica Et28A]
MDLMPLIFRELHHVEASVNSAPAKRSREVPIRFSVDFSNANKADRMGHAVPCPAKNESDSELSTTSTPFLFVVVRICGVKPASVERYMDSIGLVRLDQKASLGLYPACDVQFQPQRTRQRFQQLDKYLLPPHQ